MKTATVSARPAWFRIVAIVFLLWNLIGIYMFWSQYNMTPEQLAAFTPAQQTLWNGMPAWMWAVYAIAVFSGALGALLLVLNKRLALPLFVVSLIAIVIQFAQAFFPGGAVELLGAGMALPMPAFIAAVALLQIWVTRKAITRGWIG